MKNLAVILAVSTYLRADPLPACTRDGEAVAEVIKSSGRFETLVISGDNGAAEVKQELVEFVNANKGEKIDQFVFYFTGHGDLVGEEFYYILSDYEKTRIKQTSLENSELDNLVRSLVPQLFVKIVDACHSGVSYIKSAEQLQEYIKGTKDRFSSVYFMFSSLSGQKSYADDNLSDFTKCIVEAVKCQQGKMARYKDIMDFVSDYFELNASQNSIFCRAGCVYRSIL